jgi:ubiquinone/menaquinone biosynthesis C-methylase UbiE
MMETNPYIQSLLEANPLREPLLRSIIRAMPFPHGSRGLDVGCGVGLQALLLAEAVGHDGHITGVDISPALLAFAANLIAEAGCTERITFKEADSNHLPFGDHTFDWAWSADCVGYPAGELAPALAELIRVVKPGGSIILLGWTSQQVLPGYPLLEAHLNATYSGYRPYLEGQKPEAHFLRTARWMCEAGLENVTAQTFVGEARSPLTGGERIALTSLFKMLWTAPSLEAYQHLCLPDSRDFILDQKDYYAFFTYTVFRGVVPRTNR